MDGSKLLILLKSLSDKELRWFERYVNSPFFNVNEDIRNLLAILGKYHPEYSSSKLGAEKVFSKLFPTEKFNKNKFKHAVSDTTVLLEDYLAFVEYKRQSFYKNYFLLESYNGRQINKYFTESLQQYSKSKERETFRDSTYFFEQYQINELVYANISIQQGRASQIELQQTIDNLDVFYLSTKLKYCCEIINKQNIISEDYHISMFDETLIHLKKNNYDHIPAITIYHSILMGLLESENESHYKQLIELLHKNSAYFKKDELRDMYAFAQNYCIKKINSNQSQYLREIFNLYKTLLDKAILIHNQILSQWDYKNIVVAGLRLGEFEWVEQFINEYKEKLLSKDQENAYTYNLAYLYFYKTDYRKTLRLLQSVEFTDIYYQLDSKALLLKTYYEAGDIEPLLSMLDSFKAFLRRNQQISEYQNKAYSNFVSLVQKCAELQYDKKGKIEDLQAQLKKTSPLADISWLNNKINEMPNSNTQQA